MKCQGLECAIAFRSLRIPVRELRMGGLRPVGFGEPNTSGQHIEKSHFDDCGTQRIVRCIHKARVEAEADDSAWGRVCDPVVPDRSHPCRVARWRWRLRHLRILERDHTAEPGRRVVALIEKSLEVAHGTPAVLVLTRCHEAERIRSVLCRPPQFQGPAEASASGSLWVSKVQKGKAQLYVIGIPSDRLEAERLRAADAHVCVKIGIDDNCRREQVGDPHLKGP